jgi:hypothetical protein
LSSLLELASGTRRRIHPMQSRGCAITQIIS